MPAVWKNVKQEEINRECFNKSYQPNEKKREREREDKATVLNESANKT